MLYPRIDFKNVAMKHILSNPFIDRKFDITKYQTSIERYYNTKH